MRFIKRFKDYTWNDARMIRKQNKALTYLFKTMRANFYDIKDMFISIFTCRAIYRVSMHRKLCFVCNS